MKDVWQKYVDQIDFDLSRESAQKKLDSWTEQEYIKAERLFHLLKADQNFMGYIIADSDITPEEALVSIIFNDINEDNPTISYSAFHADLLQKVKETASRFPLPGVNWFTDALKAKIIQSLNESELEEFNLQLKKFRNNMLEDITRSFVYLIDEGGLNSVSNWSLLELEVETDDGLKLGDERLIQAIHEAYEYSSDIIMDLD